MNATSLLGGSLQQQVLQRYTALMLLKPGWAGELLLVCGLNEAGTVLALASNIAGAVCLSIEPDAQRVKAAQRMGACDFAVNTLDEALRTMKNEVRKGRALSVGLQGKIETILAEVLERGLAPAVAVDSIGGVSSFPDLRDLGATLVSFESGSAFADGYGSALVDGWAEQKGFDRHSVAAADFADLKALDAQLAQLLPEDNSLRRRWIERAPQHFQRDRPLSRAVWLREDEVLRLRANGRQI